MEWLIIVLLLALAGMFILAIRDTDKIKELKKQNSFLIAENQDMQKDLVHAAFKMQTIEKSLHEQQGESLRVFAHHHKKLTQPVYKKNKNGQWYDAKSGKFVNKKC